MLISLDELASRLEELPPLSDTSSRLSEAIEHPACSIEMLAQVIERDATLAQRVLKLANSAFYSVPGGVDSIKRAVTFVGFSSVHQIALYVSAMAILNQNRPIPPALMRHAGAVATISRYLAVQKKLAKREGALAAGLLHDLGWLALHVLFPDHCARYTAEVLKGAAHGNSAELETLGVTHEAVGARLAAKWRFPEPLVRLIGDHHGPGAPGVPADDPYLQLTDVVAVADVWAGVIGRPGLALAVKTPTQFDPARFARARLPETPDPEHLQALQVLLASESMFS